MSSKNKSASPEALNGTRSGRQDQEGRNQAETILAEQRELTTQTVQDIAKRLDSTACSTIPQANSLQPASLELSQFNADAAVKIIPTTIMQTEPGDILRVIVD